MIMEYTNDSELNELITKSNNIAVFSGAGVSVNSGIQSFRTANGLYSCEYKGYSPETILSDSFFKKNKKVFWEFLNDVLLENNVEPNSAHIFAKKLCNENKLTGVITQNIDGLYNQLDLNKLVEIHGNVDLGYCEKCGEMYFLNQLTKNKNGIYLSPCHNWEIHPDVVLYGETFNTKKLEKYFEILNEADTLIVMGTGLDISFHKDNVIQFNGKIILINDSDVNLLGWAGQREWTYKLIDSFENIF